jgi:hypothetical protein
MENESLSMLSVVESHKWSLFNAFHCEKRCQNLTQVEIPYIKSFI